ncbi:Dipeptidyl aminopeptidase/acylaminoacyl peptidase [Pedobacter steynii]|uniref:Dipeptidyl aminopeptidase/acylaminoacyl peptidase n=1 Tax=Pedobacter steynii TaxID=430522 RepID=A0A1H0DZZ4_9SPHI|nr:prolyl oligopeptidase family serine peptidase [Pedobacter steynii]NQX41878.1 prolyl oligopeptidase family serine peptidase [Pedobacter steynii]SDN75561.1 Dipeptidyl aminopeptidase/acylaminoacyl peptidase [Pedobacter steynii]
MKKSIALFLLLGTAAQAQQVAPLTVEKIMRDQKWLGVAPSNFRWAADSKTVFFDWNPENKEKNEGYQVNVSSGKIEKASEKLKESSIGMSYMYADNGSRGIAEKEGDIYLYNLKTKKEQRLTRTMERESNAGFLKNGNVVFQRGENLFLLDLNSSEIRQVTNFVKGKPGAAADKKKLLVQGNWLKEDQTNLFDIIKKKNKENNPAKGIFDKVNDSPKEKPLRALYLGEKFLTGLVISPDARYVSYKLITPPSGGTNTIVPNYVTSSGYTEDIAGRTKVGEPIPTYESFIYDQQRDTVYSVHTEQIPGIKDLPDYVKDYPKQLEERKKKNEDRQVNLSGPFWNESGSAAILVADALDNKDLWILKLDAATGNLSIIDRQRDEAWIGGPGIGPRNIGWVDQNRFYFQSEASGYSHVYLANITTGEKKQLTSGKWEVQKLQLSKDKKTFYISGNKTHPGITHFYKLDVNGGNLIQLTSLKGGNEVTLSPDEKWLAINYSYMNKPWELYLQANKPGAKAVQVTNSSSKEFNSYQWREPDLVSFKNRYGADVYARVYPTSKPHPNRPAVVFVHGAGYLQNVHYWWSQYSREYMFNNLLADNGYTVIDIDYTASSGYGRDHRTGIYRHMGGKDLTDQVDGVKMLIEKYNVDPKHVGLYGGSYGGFITLMALFNEPEVFASGGALRSVTDWAHYNHGYTSNILNEPYNDELAYKRSSPIYFANGLKGDLLMCHGMVDVNVHFQDIVRLSQRLIELGKNNWELAVYPVEDHGFVEPSSWTDEYKRIFKLFETTLKK